MKYVVVILINQPATIYAWVYIQKKKPVLFLCLHVHTLKMYWQLAIVSLTDDDLPLTCNNTASIDSTAKVLLVKLKLDKETKFTVDEFLSKLFEQYCIENCGKSY